MRRHDAPGGTTDIDHGFTGRARVLVTQAMLSSRQVAGAPVAGLSLSGAER